MEENLILVKEMIVDPCFSIGFEVIWHQHNRHTDMTESRNLTANGKNHSFCTQ